MHTFPYAALTGCFGPSEGPARDKPDVLVAAVPTTPATLNPALAAGSFTQEPRPADVSAPAARRPG